MSANGRYQHFGIGSLPVICGQDSGPRCLPNDLFGAAVAEFVGVDQVDEAQLGDAIEATPYRRVPVLGGSTGRPT